MRPLSLTLENVGPFPSLDLTFADGVTALAGPNGAGKSTVLNAIELALFARGARDLAPLLGPFADRLEIDLRFEHAGRFYRVRRTYASRGRGAATLDFHEFDEGEFLALNRETAAETQDAIGALLGLSRGTFAASAFLGQGNAAMFADADPAERKSIIAEVLDPRGLWPALCERARAEAREAEQTVAVARARIADLEERLNGRTAAVDLVDYTQGREADERELLEYHEGLLAEAQETLAANQAALERFKGLGLAADTARRERDRAEQEYAQAQRADVALTDARTELVTVQAAAARVSELERLVEEQRVERETYMERLRAKRTASERATVAEADWNRLHSEHRTADALLCLLVEKRADLETAEQPRCDRCEQTVGGEALAVALASIEGEITEARNIRDALREAADFARTASDEAREAVAAIELPPVPLPEAEAAETHDLARARDAARQAAVLAERVTNLETLAAKLPDLAGDHLAAKQTLIDAEGALEAAKAETRAIGDEGSLIRAVDDRKVEVSRCQRALTQATETLTRARVAVEQLEQAAVDLAAIAESVSESQQRLDVLRLAERAFGRDGVPVLLLETVIPQIEAEANRVLSLMPTAKGETFRVELRTLKNVKADDRLRETLDIVVYGAGDARPYETFSGGERGRLNVALRLALAHVLATRRGAEVRMLALDEVEYLDVLGQEQLVDVLRSVETVFGCVLVVSHHPNVRDAFESVVELETDGNGASRIAGARDAPAFDRLPTPEDGYVGHKEAM